MNLKIPLLLMPQKQVLGISRPFYPLASKLIKKHRFLEKDLHKLEADITPTSYLSAIMLNAVVYFIMAEILAFTILYRMQVKNAIVLALAAGIFAGSAVFFFSLVYPHWVAGKRVKDIDRDLLFAARHLRIQTTAGVPLFESLVSASHGYGAVSSEIEKIVTSVQGGVSMADALEDSAARNPSYYYSRILWQMSNAVKAGTDIGPVLAEIVDFLAEEQRIEMRNYGAQLNTLAIMYLMACIIMPTISLIFIMV
ncbi:MAG: type II secretion system F family protein, partial [Candidatus Anstonellaceae archaeon]